MSEKSINAGEIDVIEINAGIITKKGGKTMKPDKKFPLFIVTGASGVGKSTMCEILFKKETDYIVLESDILWQEVLLLPFVIWADERIIYRLYVRHFPDAQFLLRSGG